jgi:hypothetical protein
MSSTATKKELVDFLWEWAESHHDWVKLLIHKVVTSESSLSLPTYHKYFKQLQELGYVKYKSSYHPGCRSEVELYQRGYLIN